MDEYAQVEGEAEWMVIRLRDGELYDIEVRQWEAYLNRRPDTTAVELTRGLTKTDAMNLTMLGNKQRSMER